jgi:hypothetical protein
VLVSIDELGNNARKRMKKQENRKHEQLNVKNKHDKHEQDEGEQLT